VKSAKSAVPISGSGLKALQMCVAKPRWVFQTIPKQTINADVSGPNQSVRHQRELLERHCPRIHLSDGRGKEGPINRCGNPIVRWTLVEMVWRLMIWQPNYGPVRLLATGLVKSKRATPETTSI
jgi:hypothetical protein